MFGNVTKDLVKAHPHLKFIIQGQPAVVEDGLRARTRDIFLQLV
jgi:hypothetical protein